MNIPELERLLALPLAHPDEINVLAGLPPPPSSAVQRQRAVNQVGPDPMKRRRRMSLVVVVAAATILSGLVFYGMSGPTTQTSAVTPTKTPLRVSSTARLLPVSSPTAAPSAAAAARATTPTASTQGASPNLAPTGLDIHTLIDWASPSVIPIEIGQLTQGGQVQPVAAGSGVVISADGLIVTNAHVVDLTDHRGPPMTNAVITAIIADGSSRSIEVLGASPQNDIAIIRLKDTTNLVPAVLGILMRFGSVTTLSPSATRSISARHRQSPKALFRRRTQPQHRREHHPQGTAQDRRTDQSWKLRWSTRERGGTTDRHSVSRYP